MGQYFIVANIDKRQYIDPANFKTHDDGAGFSMKLHHICTSIFAGVLPFLLATSDYYPYMGTWAGDRTVVIGDESPGGLDRIHEIRAEWSEVTRGAASSYFDFIKESGGLSGAPLGRLRDLARRVAGELAIWEDSAGEDEAESTKGSGGNSCLRGIMDEKDRWIGGKLVDYGAPMDKAILEEGTYPIQTEIVDLTLTDRWFGVIGREFDCGGLPSTLRTTFNEPKNRLVIVGYQDHRYDIEQKR